MEQMRCKKLQAHKTDIMYYFLSRLLWY